MAGIFISYRREDSGPYAGRLYDRLRNHFGKEQIFMDVDTLQPGEDFVEVLRNTLASCDVLVAVIGKKWLTIKNKNGQRRLEDPEDYVRLEITAALERGVRVIPVLVGGALMPPSSSLPDVLKKLVQRQALTLPDIGFHQSVSLLIETMDTAMKAAQKPREQQRKQGAEWWKTEQTIHEKDPIQERTEQQKKSEATFAATSEARPEQLEKTVAARSPFAKETVLAPEKVWKAHRVTKLVRTLFLAAFVIVLAFWIWKSFNPVPEPNLPIPNRVTTNGRVTQAAISPDSKYVAYAAETVSGRQALFLHQIETDTDSPLPLVQAAPLDYEGVSFSPDSSFVYYAAYEGNLGTLRRISLVGGVTQTIIKDIDSPASVSPNGKQISFIRGDPKKNVTSLMLAAADGSFERTLAKLPARTGFSGGLAWSNDNTIAAVVRSSKRNWTVIGVPAKPGQAFTPTNISYSFIGQIAFIGQITRRPAALALVAGDSDEQLHNYLIAVEMKGGHPIKTIARDENTYLTISSAQDGTVAAVQKRERTSAISIVGASNTGQAPPITFGTKRYHWVAWTSQGSILTETVKNGTPHLVQISADGQNEVSLGDSKDPQYYPRSCGNQPYVVFTSPNNDGRLKIWRMDGDGRNLQRLTHESATEGGPVCTPDGKWIIYNSDGSGQTTLWKVPVEGGNPIQLTRSVSYYPEVSPDGKYIACQMPDLDNPTKDPTVVLLFSDLSVVRRFGSIPDMSPIRWGPAVNDLTFLKTDDKGVSNLFIQPLAGGPPRQITHFDDRQIFAFDWSHNFSQLAILRGSQASDVVIFRPQ